MSIAPVTSSSPLPTISIEVSRDIHELEWSVKAITFRTTKGVIRHIFREIASLAETLNARLAGFMESKLDGMEPRDILALPEAFDLPDGTTLHKFRFMAAEVVDGVRRATVNVFQMIGSTSSLFSRTYQRILGIEETAQRVAAKALVDLINPCLDLLHAPLHSRTDEVESRLSTRLDQLAEIQTELTFWAGLLTRYAATEPVVHELDDRDRLDLGFERLSKQS